MSELAKRLRAWAEHPSIRFGAMEADLLAAAEIVERAEKESALLDQLEKLAEENAGGLLIHHQRGDVKWTGVGLGLSHRSLRKAVSDTLPAPPEVKP